MGEVKTVGIVGFGVMGAAIGLNAAQAGYRIIFKELNDELVQTAFQDRILGHFKKQIKKGKITESEVDTIVSQIRGTSNYEELAECDLVIEAAVEKLELKLDIFEQLNKVLDKRAIIVSNTSSYMIEMLMKNISGPERTGGLHYFFPANVNRLVEVIRQQQTSDDTYEALMNFAERVGKIPITVKDFPGFAINPIFIAAYLVTDSFIGPDYNIATLEDITKDALGTRFGIPWVQNGSGIGTCYHAGVSMNEFLGHTDMGYPSVPESLKEMFESRQLMNLNDGPVLEDPEIRKIVSDRLLGTIFAISTHLIEKEIVSISDLELGICTSLAWSKGPFSMMNDMGMEKAKQLIQKAVSAGDCKIPQRFAADVPLPWELS